MRRFSFFLTLLFLVIGTDAVRAQPVARSVLVVDSLDGHAIAEVAIAVDGIAQPSTDRTGKALLRWDGRSEARVRFEHVSYHPLEMRLNELAKIDGVVRLVPRDNQLGAVTIGRNAPEVVFERPDLHAADLFMNDDGVWVLAYEHPRMLRAQVDASKEILRDVRLVLLDTSFKEVASCPVPEDVLGLRHDLRHALVIEGARHAFSVGSRGDELVLRPFGLEELRHAVLPWTDSIPGWVLGSNAASDYPALDQLAFGPVQDTLRRICSVVDTFMMDLFRAQYKYLKGPEKVAAMNLAAELGMEKEVVAGYMSGFSKNIWYKPLYAPLFVVGDTMLVFDHARSRLRKFTRSFAEAAAVPLTYTVKPEGRDWSGKLVQDRATQQIYAVFGRNGAVWVRSVDPITGELGIRFRLARTYPERVQVHAGKVYYIWRPVGSLQKRTVYRETM